MDNLNYHHLRYFREVAREGHLTRAAERLNLSQSALSSQIRALEDRLGHPLFHRVGRKLTLSEVGRITLDYADRIFSTGEDLLATLQRSGANTPPMRIGSLSTLSRNFQLEFLRPILQRDDLDLTLKSGSPDVLLDALRAMSLDVVLTTEPPASGHGLDFLAQKLAQQPVSIHAAPALLQHDSLAALLSHEAVILPTESSIRTGFDALVARLGIAPNVAAVVDDMAMVRLLAREGAGLAIAPAVVFADELKAGRVARAPFDLQIVESFYAVTVRRSFPHPLLRDLIAAFAPSAPV